ncbi:hypothetical protein PHEL49_1942 [Polaribacter sp. Hel1_33_49]|nr:hypothetical protein PHEL49_1942 [Polaribacter sp. Hel1_33_49]
MDHLKFLIYLVFVSSKDGFYQCIAKYKHYFFWQYFIILKEQKI